MAKPLIEKIENHTEIDRILNTKFTSKARTGYVEVGEDKICLPIYYQHYEEMIRKFRTRNDDVFITGMAKSGTTWCQEMVWLLVNNFDYEGAKTSTFIRCPLLEFPSLYDMNIVKPDGVPENFKMETYLGNLKGPRVIKTHLHWSLLPEEIRNNTKQPKIIHIFRNPKDTCVSHYHQSRFSGGFSGNFEEFSRLYLNGRVPYGPFWKYALSFWNQKRRPNIFFVSYEQMKADLTNTIRKASNFLGKDITDEQLTKLQNHLSFARMKGNPATNLKDEIGKWSAKYNLMVAESETVRSGKVGGFSSLMSPEIEGKFDQWAAQNLTGVDFPFYVK